MDTDDVIRQTVPLGPQWPTIDPFLFCAHHDDAYPSGDGSLAPAASIAGRSIGQDFSGLDGWSMYHGSTVPGFPAHPHRGFETVTYVRRGLVDHADSLGAVARYGAGDNQWLTAGRGIVHAEMFPLVETADDNPLELFQIWLNLPSSDKLVDPSFTMFWADDIPRHRHTDAAGRLTEVTVIAGELDDIRPLAPPPASWATRAEADVAIWHVRLEGDASWTLPAAAGSDTIRTLYLFAGEGLTIADGTIGSATGAVVACDRPVTIGAPAGGAELLVLQGRPIGEPVARYGPFVMNSEAEIHQAFADYQATGFGGWPWDRDDPVHGPDPARFART